MLLRLLPMTGNLRRSMATCCNFPLGGRQLHCQKELPTRTEQLESLKTNDFDVLVIGGGASGTGCALDATTRGLKTALVEAGDFASGASSKSSKLIDGGSSYLRSIMGDANMSHLYVLQESMKERSIMMHIAPHLNRPLPMMMPIYSAAQQLSTWLGCKIYDCLAGKANLKGSHFASKEATLNEFPLLREEGLRGSIVYYDCQHDDARMCIALAITAAQQGATVANYVKVENLDKEQGHCRTARLVDSLTGEKFNINAKCIINATGALTDAVRCMDDPAAEPIAAPSYGTLMSLPSYFGSSRYGLVSPVLKCTDQTLLMVPWENRTLVGTVDNQGKYCDINKPPAPLPEEICSLLQHTRSFLTNKVQLDQHHVCSAWKGVRPTVISPYPEKQRPDNPEPVLNYLVEVSDCNLITLAGGRWNSYRTMAMEAINAGIQFCDLKPKHNSSRTKNLLLDGAQGWNCMLPLDLAQNYNVDMDVAEHLSEAYGSNAHHLLAESTPSSRRRLHSNFPYIEAEVYYACNQEYACSLVDVIARRLRVAFVDVKASLEMLPKILAIMSMIHNWKRGEQKQQLMLARQFLVSQMGLDSVVKIKNLYRAKKESQIQQKQRVASVEQPPLRTDAQGVVSWPSLAASLPPKQQRNEGVALAACIPMRVVQQQQRQRKESYSQSTKQKLHQQQFFGNDPTEEDSIMMPSTHPAALVYPSTNSIQSNKVTALNEKWRNQFMC